MELECLEERQLLSTILWANRGSASSDTDGFNAVYGANAATARAVVDAAILAWQNVISDFHFSDGTNTFQLGVFTSSDDGGTGASASFPTRIDANGKPQAGNIHIGSGNNGHGGGFFLDPTPTDSAEFRGNIVNAFAGDAPSDSPAAGLADLYTVVTLEITHELGLTSDSGLAFRQDPNHFLTNTHVTDKAFGVGTLFTFNGPSVQALFTSNNGGSGGSDFGVALHTAEPSNTFTDPAGVTFFGAQDSGNATFELGRRYLPSLLDTLVLKDAYGYSVTDPHAFGTFYANLDRTTGNLLVRGGTDFFVNLNSPAGDLFLPSDDTFRIVYSSSTLSVATDIGHLVAGTGGSGTLPSSFNISDVKSITIEAGGGNDVINLDSLTGTPITVNAGAGNDVINLGTGDLNRLTGAVTINGQGGTDTVTFQDSANTSSDTYIVTASTISRPVFGGATFNDVDRVVLNAEAGDNTFDILSDGPALTINAGPGNDTFRLHPGLSSVLTINGQAGKDTLDYSAFITGVRVQLPQQTATATISGGARSIENAIGGSGNDFLFGDAGNNILIGGRGSDRIDGGDGFDILIGGTGADIITGAGGDDILIGGTTSFDARMAAIQAILAEWTSGRDLNTRVANINGTGAGARLNGNFFLKRSGLGQTVFEDGPGDQLTGGAGADWFFTNISEFTDLSLLIDRLN
jgi:Ca2+-binding RTX toxin-like protein